MVQTSYGGPEVVHLQDVGQPQPGSEDLLVQVGACGLNRLDVLQRRGPGVLPNFSLPHIGGMDIAGTVVGIGSDVTGRQLGERVVVDPTQGCGSCPRCQVGDRGYCSQLRVLGGNAPGGLAEFVAVRADTTVGIPDDVALDEAAALPTAWATAWHAVHAAGRAMPGECVVVQAGASALSLATIQLLRHLGSKVIAVASSERKLAAARAAGADLGIANDGQLSAAVQDFTQGRGADLVIDHVGAATWEASLGCLGIGGRIVLLGNTSGDRVSFSLADVFHRGLRLIGAGGYTAADFSSAMLTCFQAGLRMPAAAQFVLDDLPLAWASVESRETVGKVIVLL